MESFIRKILFLLGLFKYLPNKKSEFKSLRPVIKHVLKYKYLMPLNQKNLDYKKDAMPSYKSRILLVTHEFSRSGAPVVALETAKIIEEIYNIKPLILSQENGPLREEFINAGFETILPCDVPKYKNHFMDFLAKFDLIFVSSCSWAFFDAAKGTKTPIVLYSHEVFDTFIFPLFCGFCDIAKEYYPMCKKIFCGGPAVLEAIKKSGTHTPLKLLNYSVKEAPLPKIEKTSDKFIFILPGSIETRKNQKLLLKAISLMQPEILNKAEFYIIGKMLNDGEKLYFEETLAEIEKYDNVKFVQDLPLDKLFEYYAISDCILSCSIKDPMPVIVTYAFMFKKLALISDAIGTSLLAKDNETAVLFKSNNEIELKNKLEDIIQNKEKYSNIAKKGREIYDKYFSETNFKKILKENLDEYLL